MEMRSQSMLKEALFRDAGNSFGSRITVLEEKMEDQAEKLNHKLDQHIAEIFEVIRLISYPKGQTSAYKRSEIRSSFFDVELIRIWKR